MVRLISIAGFVALVACGGSEGGSGSTGAGGGSGTTGSGGSSGSGSSSGGSGPGGTGSGGASGGAGSGGAGSGGTGAGTVDCSGAFGAPELLFREPEWDLGTPSLTSDELEIFYLITSLAPDPVVDHVAHRTRATRDASFSSSQTFPELDDLCDPSLDILSIEISSDGLELYYVCTEIGNEFASGTLRRAARPDRSSPFTLSAESLGTVGRAPALSADRLQLFSLSTSADHLGPELYERASPASAFGEPTSVAGIEVQMRWPDISADGLSLFGTRVFDAVTSSAPLLVATRQTTQSAFSAPTNVGLPAEIDYVTDAGAAISDDCRRLYFVRSESMTAPSVRGIYVISR